MGLYRDNESSQEPSHYRPQPPHHHHRPCAQNFCHSHTYYKYAAVAVLTCGFIALLVIFWKCCKTKGDGRVIAQPTPPPQEPVKPSPPPYNPNDYDNPPPYHACVPEELHQQQFGAASQQVSVSDENCTSAATAPPPKYYLPSPTHVVNIPDNTARY